MSNNQPIRKTLLAASLAALLTTMASAAIAGDEEKAGKIHVDPVTGEVIEYSKLISEMTDEEKAELSDEERKQLEAIEAASKAKEAGDNSGS